MSDQTSKKTLDSSSSSSTSQIDHPQPQSTIVDSSSLSSAIDEAAASSLSSLTRNLSASKLNAKAPEFVPKKSITPPPTTPPVNSGDPRVLIVPPPPPPPPSVVHVYPPPPPPPQVNSPFPVMPLPHMNHHHHPHHRNDQSHRNDHHHHPRSDHHHHQRKHHHQRGSNSDQEDKDKENNTAVTKNNNGLSDESTQKLINQVEYYFSDVNLATTDHLIRFISKDPEGFVPISVVSSFKKIKALVGSNAQLAAVLRNSTKLVVSEDGKKVKRLHPLTDMEELQARIIVAENLPDDHCHQNLMKIFSTVGSVKSIRTCQPQPSNNGASPAARPSKNDNMLYCNKLHAFVEYETIELAEKAISELNDEGDWRNGLRVRPLLKHGVNCKTAQARGKKSGNEGEVTCEEEDASTSEQNQNEKQSEDFSGQSDFYTHEHGEELLEKEGGQKKSRNRGRGKGRGRGHQNHHNHHQNNRGHHVGSPPINNAVNGEHPIVAKQQPPGPRMPDGTRGFSMGRGRPVAVNTTA